jgi:hypothetical protein
VQLEHVPALLATVLPIDVTPSVSVPTVTVKNFSTGTGTLSGPDELFAPTVTDCVQEVPAAAPEEQFQPSALPE